LFWHLCRKSFSPRVAGLAVAILAVSYYPVRHGAEVKPYSFDLFFAVVFAWLTLGYLRDLGTRWLVALMLVAPVAIFSSYPSAFVGGAVSLVLLPRMLAATWTQRSLWIGFNLALGGAFIVHYLLVGQQGADPAEVERAHEFLRTYWKDAFPPETALQWPLWLVKVFTGNMLAYPVGAHNGGSTLTFLFLLLGTFALRRNGSLVALCWLPFALNLVAACLHKYPFGGSARITLHLAPFICILMAHGVAQALDGIRAPVWRTRAEFAFVALLLSCGVGGVTRDLLFPYKTIHDRDVRQLVHDISATVSNNEPILLCHERDEDVIAEFTWYLRTQPWRLDFLAAHPLEHETQICLILCSNHELRDADVLSRLGGHARDWRIEQSDMRRVPPENKALPPFYARWVHLVRAGQ
jgi:dolichyl-phosphate-mannose-protein mannosyltransferase